MENKNTTVIDNLKTQIQDSKKMGHETVPLHVLEHYLSDELKSAAEKNAVYTHEMEIWKINAPLHNAESLEMFKAVLETGLTAIKSATLINGGAAVALLAFLGSSVNSNEFGRLASMQLLSYALICFVIGVGLAGLTSGFRYISQAIYSEADELSKQEKLGDYFRNAAIFTGSLSFISFVAGGIYSACGFLS